MTGRPVPYIARSEALWPDPINPTSRGCITWPGGDADGPSLSPLDALYPGCC
jgi:hypothetical protein